jgi:5-formyltetrahydrofolate cyclo-ligase
MNKALLRCQMIARRKQLSTKQRIRAQQDLLDKLSCHPIWMASRRVGLYQAFGSELDMKACVAMAESQGKTVYFPAVQGEDMIFEKQGASVEKGIPQCFLVPSIAIDEHGYRLGYGKGYYDRYLSSIKHEDWVAIGVAFDCCRVFTIFPERHDVPMSQVIFADTHQQE